MLTLTLDRRITRRKYYHVINDERGEYVFKAKLVGDCLEWLYAHEIDAIAVVSDNGRWLLHLARAVDQKD